MNTCYTPAYYDRFVCAAQNCTDTCCAQWEIVIDDDSLDYYRNAEGEFAEEIRRAVTEDADGDHCFRLCNGRCPFLNQDNLCEIHIRMGEEHTCAVCREHPRFTEEYDGFTELSLSLSCPSASSLIRSSVLDHTTYPVPVSDGTDELLDELIVFRSAVLDTVVSADTRTAAGELLSRALMLQSQIDGEKYEYDISLSQLFGNDWIAFLLDETEILTDEWRRILEECLDKNVSADIGFENTEKIFAYFVYRYGLKSINDMDVIGYSLYILSAVFTASLIAEKTNVPFEEAARLYSKETEHNTENIEIIRDYLCWAFSKNAKE